MRHQGRAARKRLCKRLKAQLNAGETVLELLDSVQQKVLDSFQRSLQHSSTSLTAVGCWQFLEDKLHESRRYGLEKELRQLVFTAAGNFADKRMLRLTSRIIKR